MLRCIILLSILLGTGCATVVNNSETSVSLQSVPSQAEFIINNQDGHTIATGVTPSIISLDASHGYFTSENYKISFSKPGYQSKIISLNSSLSGWYWGNLVFGSWVGFLVIDPLTGDMWKLPNAIIVHLPPELKKASTEDSIKVISLSDVPNNIRNSLVRIN